MRRSDREIKEFNELINVMERCDVCRLAFFDEEYPYILPLNFGMQVMDDKITLYFHGALEGKKYDLMAKNNKVGFEMDCSHRLVTDVETKNCTMEYESIIGTGILEYVDEQDKYDALYLLMKHYHKEDFEFNKEVMSRTKIFKLIVKDFAGKRRLKK